MSAGAGGRLRGCLCSSAAGGNMRRRHQQQGPGTSGTCIEASLALQVVPSSPPLPPLVAHRGRGTAGAGRCSG
jgi:hypothetical protein